MRGLAAAGTTVVSVLHELTMALQADALAIVADGRCCTTAAAPTPATHAALERVFGHRIRVRQVEGQWIALPCI